MIKKKKILFFLPGSVGGAERITITIAKMLPLDNYDVFFVIVGKDRGEIEKFIPECYKVSFLKVNNIWDFVTLRIYALMRKEKPDYAFCSLRFLSPRVILAGLLTGGVKTIIRSENTWIKAYNLQRWINQAYCKYTFPKAYKIISQQEEMKEDMLKFMPFLDPEKIVVLYNPIDTKTIDVKATAHNPYPVDDSINYVWVGRFAKEKGQDVLAKAFVEVHKKNTNTHLYFVGKYDEKSDFFNEIKETVDRNNIADYVHFVGFDSNPYRWVKHCDCFVLPSRIEGLPNSLLEAMYLGRPVVATTCIPVIDRMVEEGINGYKVPSEDYNAMAEAMIKALELKECKLTFKSSTSNDFIDLFK